MMKKSIWRETKGVFELPVQYMVAIVVAAIAIGIVSFAGYHLWRDMQTDKAVKEVNRIVSEATSMYATADEGTIQTMNVDFPAGMKKACFGSSDPRNANHYYIVMDWGENRSFYATDTNFSHCSILHEGISSVQLELIEEDGKYVQVKAA